MLIRLAALLLIAPASAGHAAMNDTYTVGNRHIARQVVVRGGVISTDSIGRPGDEVTVSGGDEFAVIVGPEKTRLTAAEFSVTSIRPVNSSAGLIVKLVNRRRGLEAQVRYYCNPRDSYIRKSVTFRNTGKEPVQILDVEVESLRLPSAEAAGVGKPVYAAAKLFLGLEFPLGGNEAANGLVTLRHRPGKTLKPGQSFTAKSAVIGAAAKGESVQEAFDEYVRRIALRKPEVTTVYGNWAVYDYLSDTVRPDEKMVLRTVDELAALRKLGWQPDYYVMDAGWFDTRGDYTDYVKPAWPDGPRRMVDAIHGVGIEYGLWFDTGGGIIDNPEMAASKYSSGRLCLASEPYISTFKNALVRQIEQNGLRMVKFDFATFGCDNEKHDHLFGEYASEACLTSFLDMLDSVRKRFPDVKYIIFNGFHRSPWWLMHVDTIYTNDPAPGDKPTLRLRDSINRRTDQCVRSHRFEHLLPWYCIDDCGLMIGRMGTIYWIGAEEFRKTWVLNIGRGGMMPFIYGDLGLLDGADRRFLVKMWNVVRDNPKVFADTRAILGAPNGDEVYGYSHFSGSHGFIFLNNPTFEVKQVAIPLDSSIGLDSQRSPLNVYEIFPVECAYAAEGKAGFRRGGKLGIELAPFEVRALEIKAGPTPESASAPRKAAFGSIALPIKPTQRESTWVTDAALGMANKGLAHLAAASTLRPAPVALDRAALEQIDGIHSGDIQLPTFDKPQTLALPVQFFADGQPHFYNNPTSRALVVAWSDDGQIFLKSTPEYGRKIWSSCPWVTFHARLDPSLSGKKLQLALFGLKLEGAALTLDKVYLLDQPRQPNNTGP
ncbi:MAG: hypothetical protein Q7T82_13660 [Armatimonadota bacterium]|nr:hypothetical protein [Armatimonadota bacterium]